MLDFKMDWDRLPASRWGLRQLGVVLLIASYSAAHHMLAIGSIHGSTQPPLVYLLALVAFTCFSAGSAFLVHGHHLFDKIEISERWRRLPPADHGSVPAKLNDRKFGADGGR